MFENDFHRSGQLQNLNILLMQTFYSKDINMCLNFLDKATNIAKIKSTRTILQFSKLLPIYLSQSLAITIPSYKVQNILIHNIYTKL